MSAWRKQALETLPEYRQLIDKSENPMALWVELQFQFSSGYKKHGDNLIHRFHQYAEWCYESPGQGGYLSDAGTAAQVAFYERLANEKVVQEDVYRWLTKEEFLKLEGSFHHSLLPQQYDGVKADFLEKQAKFIQQASKARK